MTTACGTPAYMAPEILLGHPYTSSVDYWSIGVILYLLLSGKLPFEGEAVIEKIKCCEPDFSGPSWKGISPQARDLCRGLLVKDPQRRITVEEVLEHPWVTQAGHFGTYIQELNERLLCYNLYKRLSSSRRTTVGEIRIEMIKKRINSIMEIE
jgi:serine/threonine protein kinase